MKPYVCPYPTAYSISTTCRPVDDPSHALQDKCGQPAAEDIFNFDFTEEAPLGFATVQGTWTGIRAPGPPSAEVDLEFDFDDGPSLQVVG